MYYLLGRYWLSNKVSKRFRCKFCKALDEDGGIGGWSVEIEFWQRVMGEDAKKIICIHCFEKRLGRRIRADELLINSGDNQTNEYVQLIWRESQKVQTELEEHIKYLT